MIYFYIGPVFMLILLLARFLSLSLFLLACTIAMIALTLPSLGPGQGVIE